MNVRLSRQAPPRPPASDPDDAKTPPEPVIKAHPAQQAASAAERTGWTAAGHAGLRPGPPGPAARSHPAQPSAPAADRPGPTVTQAGDPPGSASTSQAGDPPGPMSTSQTGDRRPAALGPAAPSRPAPDSPAAAAPVPPARPPALAAEHRGRTATQAGARPGVPGPAAPSRPAPDSPALAAPVPPARPPVPAADRPGRTAASQAGAGGAQAAPPPQSAAGESPAAMAAPPFRAGTGSPPRPVTGSSRQMSADPDDAKTAPQPAIRVRPVREVQPAWRDPAPASYDQHGLVPGMARPREQLRRAPRPRTAQPSWFTIIATTVRLWLKRRATRDRGARNAVVTGRRIRMATLALVILAAAGVGVALTRGGTKAPRQPGRGNPANPVLSVQAARAQAAAWISQQAGRNTIVSCDPVMCSALLAHGFPAGNVNALGPNAPDPLASDLIAATGVLRSHFGARLGSVYAPVTLARFGTGSAEVDIRVVAPDGAAVYLGQFRADVADRKTVGAQLLHNSKIVVDSSARRQLTSGMVDSRLLATLATMADFVHPLQIVSFGGASPGADPGVPLRTAVVSGAAGGSAGSTAVLTSLRGFLQAQQPPYLPASAQIVRVAAGQGALRIQFAAPSPLGLLSAGNPVVKIPS
jgi:hypothetical protein